jgi:two-component system LytT family sensor kinase
VSDIVEGSRSPSRPLYPNPYLGTVTHLLNRVTLRRLYSPPVVSTSRTTRHLWVAASCFWVFVGSLYLGQIWLLMHTEGVRAVGITRATWAWQGAFYLTWIPLTVAIVKLTANWDLATVGWPRLLARHVVAMLATAATQSAIVTAIGFSLIPERESMWTAFAGQLRGRLYQQVVIYAAIAMAAHAIHLYARWRARELQAAQLEAQLGAARLASLRAQLHPHFLFNSLHTIASLVRDGRNEDAVNLISGMSDLLRRLLDTPGDTHAIEDELAAAQTYLDVQRARFGDRLTAEVTLQPNAARARVPVLVVQPLVENALRHGLADRVGAGHVRVRATRDHDDVVIHVDDNGAGVPGDWRLDESNGTGLANLRGRLDAMYAGRASLVAAGRPGLGFTVTIRLPYGVS